MRRLLRTLGELKRYPSAIAGVGIILVLVIASIYAVIAIPYGQAIRLWRGADNVWQEHARNARPVWFDWFTTRSLSRTFVVRGPEQGIRTEEPLGDGTVHVRIALPFEFSYDTFPRELVLEVNATFDGTRTSHSSRWIYPDGTEVDLAAARRMRASDSYYISQDIQLMTRMPSQLAPQEGLFVDPRSPVGTKSLTPVKGQYQLIVETRIPEGHTFDAKLVVYGEIQGIAGTDHRRRDISIALLWGAPLALVFGFLGAIGSSVTTFILAGIGTWFGGLLDALFQRLTTVNMLLPLLPILIMVGQFYTRSLWVILAIIIALSIFSASYLTYRAMFLQAKEAPYIEAAKAYGAGNFRIIFRYLLPRIIPVLLPAFVLAVPSFVFFEASLSVLGLGDPILPTWGKLIYDSRQGGALFKGQYYWVIQPAVLLILTGFGFALVGFALDRIFNPRLRTM